MTSTAGPQPSRSCVAQARHGTACVNSWIEVLENDPREIRALAVDAQWMSDWLLAGQRDRSPVEERANRGQLDGRV